MNVEIPPLQLKTCSKFSNLYSLECCSVAVVYVIYDKKKKIIVKKGTSRACGDNHKEISIHAEKYVLIIVKSMIKDINMKYIFGDILKKVK